MPVNVRQRQNVYNFGLLVVDNVALALPSEGIYCDAATNTFTVTFIDDTTVAFTAVPRGTILPLRIKKAAFPGATATLIALY